MAVTGNNTVYFENECCILSGDPAIPALVFTWKGHVPAPAYQEITRESIRLMEEHKFTRILGDNSLMKTLGSEDIAWLQEFWLPSAIAAGMQFCAVVDSENAFNRMIMTEVAQKVAPGIVSIRNFSDLESARFWLISS